MRRRVLSALVIGLSLLLLAPSSSDAKRSKGKKACASSCGGGGYNKCRVVYPAKPNQCPASKWYNP